MARGSQSKTLIGKAILQIFPGSFIDADGKTVRIPTTCEGEPLEIKLSFTCAKDIIGGSPVVPITAGTVTPQNTEMTEAEIAEVKALVERLGL